MTATPNTAWARAEAERLSRDRFPNKGWHQERLALVADIESALLAAERKVKEECARIAEEWTRPDDELLEDCCDEFQTVACDCIAAAIRSTLPPTSKTE